MEMNFDSGAQGFWNAAQTVPQALALIDSNDQHFSRGEVLALANQLVHGLRAQGLQTGDVVAALLPNCLEYVALNLAVTQAGFYLVPLNWHLAAAEVAYILQDSEAKVFICHSDTGSAAEQAVNSLNFDTRNVFCVNAVDGVQGLDALIANQPSAMPDDRALGAVMFYTSGTTGKPKGVKRALMPIDPDTSAIMYTMLLSLFGIPAGGKNVHFCGSPMYHTAVMNWAVSSLHMGHVLVLHNQWDAEQMLQAVQDYKVTTTHVVPTQMVRLQKLSRTLRQQYDVSSMTHMVHTAAPVSKAVKAELLDWWGPCIYEYYASTEGGGAIATPEQWLQFPGTVGKAWPGADIKIMDDAGQQLPVGEQGNVYMQMNELTRFEYRGDKQKTEKAQLNNDYFTAGDVGYLNEQGFLFLCDRKIDMIISGGANIYPAEIESVLISHNEVLDCCVFGIPDEQWGEQIKAVVQPRSFPCDEEQLAQRLGEFLAQNIARMKLPKSYDFVQQLPRDPNGKLYKRRLRDPYWVGHEANI